MLEARRVPPLNLANAFTMLRVALVPVFAWLLVFRDPPVPVLAAVVFAAAAATDGIDGWVARRLHLVSGLGQFLDPLADKLLVGVALVALAADDRLPWWVVAVILVRDFAVSGLRIALAQRGRALPASGMGKVKTGFQIIAVLLLTTLPRGESGAQAWLYVTVGMTIGTGLKYFYDSWRGNAGEPWR
jgi:CDP-diacylglycerol--glycerol-3-phosphate 3-phosphatidyltransferase